MASLGVVAATSEEQMTDAAAKIRAVRAGIMVATSLLSAKFLFVKARTKSILRCGSNCMKNALAINNYQIPILSYVKKKLKLKHQHKSQSNV